MMFFISMYVAVCVFVLGKRLGCLEQEIPVDCKVFIEEVGNFLTATQDLITSFPWHRLVATKKWKALSRSNKRFYDIAMAYIQEKVRTSKVFQCSYWQDS